MKTVAQTSQTRPAPLATRSRLGLEAGVDVAVFIRYVNCSTQLQYDELALYLVGRLLTQRQIDRVNSHLVSCLGCRARLAKAQAALFGPETQLWQEDRIR
jgi:hypothetical protein